MKNGKFKYYLYYLKLSEFESELFAYTDSKIISEKFESFRNMNKLEKRILKLNQREIRVLTYEYHGKLLCTWNIKVYNEKRYEDMEVVTTFEEKNSFIHLKAQIGLTLPSMTKFSPIIFNNELRAALDVFMYSYIYYIFGEIRYIDGSLCSGPRAKMIEKLNLFHVDYDPSDWKGIKVDDSGILIEVMKESL